MTQQASVDLIGNRAARSQYEILFKALAITSTTIAAAGHLTTLRRIARKDRIDAIIDVLGFVLIPLSPFASLFRHSWKSIQHFRSYGRDRDAVYYFSAALGVRATITGSEEDAEESVPLLRADYGSLIKCRKEYDSRWLGRLTVILLFGCQAVTTVILGERRLWVGGPEDQRRSALAGSDVYIGIMALGGVGTAITSLGVILLNTSWHIGEISHHRVASTGSGAGARVLTALLDIRIAPEAEGAMVELRVAKLISFLIALQGSGRWQFPRPQSSSRKSIECLWPIDVNTDLSRFPDHLVAPIYQCALNTMLFAVLGPSIMVVIAGSVGRMTQLRESSYFLKGIEILFMLFRAFLNLWALGTTVLFVYWFVKDLRSLIDFRGRGEWLETMWVDPWAERLYAF